METVAKTLSESATISQCSVRYNTLQAQRFVGLSLYNYEDMRDTTPAGSFIKFLTGFLTLITLSFGLTYAVNSYATARDTNNAAAAAKAEMLKTLQ